MDAGYMIAVHAGAGYHSTKYEAQYRAGLASACQAASAALLTGGSALAAVAAAAAALEDCEVCNAGRGSNLTFGGVVECDASVMAGDGSYGAVGAVPGVANPVRVAHRLAEEQTQPLSNGRVRPMMLVGDQARAWALSRGISAAQSRQEAAEWNLSEPARRRWKKYRRIVDASSSNCDPVPADVPRQGTAEAAAAAPPPGVAAAAGRVAGDGSTAAGGTLPPGTDGTPFQKRARYEGAAPATQAPEPQHPAGDAETANSVDGIAKGSGGDESVAFDTVGCVVVDWRGRVAAGVSSGGIALKTEGRVGEAAMYGAGCWAQDEARGRPAVACSVTGVGERIMRHLVARECASQVAAAGKDGDTVSTACTAVLQQTIMQGPPPRDCGVLCVRAATSDQQPSTCQPAASAGTERNPLGWGPPGPSQRPTDVGEERESREGEARDELGGGGHLEVQVEVGVAHSAQSMAVGYMTHAMTHPRITFLRQQPAGGQRQQGGAGATNAGGISVGEGADAVKTFTVGVHWRFPAA